MITHYRGWIIEYNPKPIPTPSHDYDFWPEGDEESYCGTAKSMLDAQLAIDEELEEDE